MINVVVSCTLSFYLCDQYDDDVRDRHLRRLLCEFYDFVVLVFTVYVRALSDRAHY